MLPDDGDAVVAGHDVVAAPEDVRRRIGFLLPDERSWYLRLSGRRNLEFFAALYGLSRRRARERAGDLLVELELADASDQAFSSYSTGMRLRLSLARALIADPPVLLLDEPTRSLDPVATVRFREIVGASVERRGTAVLFATHDLHEAAAIASRVVVLSDGRVAAAVSGDAGAAGLEQALVSAES